MSKITDGFESLQENCGNEENQYWSSDVNRLLAHARALEAMLTATGSNNVYGCPTCGKLVNYSGGHSPDCALAKLLE